MSRLCNGRVVAITGAGRGIGREYALEFARHGARVVVNDLGASRSGEDSAAGPADEVVAEIVALGGEAVANYDDIADWDGAHHLVGQAVDHFGTLDVLVNNAGILRDRMLVNMDIDEWDAVIRVHLRGTFATSHWAAQYWRDQSKAGSMPDARIINTSSSSGIYGNPGQTNYAAAKAGIAAMSVVAARELARYGVTVNAIYPTAMTRMTEDIFADRPHLRDGPGGFDLLDPGNIAPLVVWLGSVRSAAVTGRVFGLRGGRVVVAEGWRAGPTEDRDRRWEPEEFDEVIPALLKEAAPNVMPDGITPVEIAVAR